MSSEYANIANPIYDGTFKYLFDDNRIAKIVLSALLGSEVLDLQFRPTEHRVFLNEFSISIFRMDFAAIVRTKDGCDKQVLIEIQKAKLPEDIMRFRRYLGSQYSSKENYIIREDAEGELKPLEIFTIYFLGHKLSHTKEPVVWVKRGLFGLGGDSEKVIDGVREEFIDALSHDSIVVQIPYLKKRRKTDLEKLLAVFDQSQKLPGGKQMLGVKMDSFPEKYKEVVRRLEKAACDRKVREQMELEDTYFEEVLDRERFVAIQMEKLQKEAEEATRREEEERKQKEEALAKLEKLEKEFERRERKGREI